MKIEKMISTIESIVGEAKGILAIDESIPTCNKRFDALGIPATKENRRAYRELLITTPYLAQYIGGVILCDETIRQEKKDGTLFTEVLREAGIAIGIKVDESAVALAGHPAEKITEGLDGLRERLAEYETLGATFAKWRAVLVLDEVRPSDGALEANAHALARYASLCQEAGMVPIIEPEVLMTGDHTIERCQEITEKSLRVVFAELAKQGVVLEAMILKPNMVMAGTDCLYQASIGEVADATVRTLFRTVPAAVPAIAFLSGGQTGPLASEHLNEMSLRYRSKMPWALTFSFARAAHQKTLEMWNGEEENVHAAQKDLHSRAHCNHLARLGRLSLGNN